MSKDAKEIMQLEQSVFRLEAQLKMWKEKATANAKENRTLMLKSGKWQVAKECLQNVVLMKDMLNEMSTDGLTLGSMAVFTSMLEMCESLENKHGNGN